MKEITYLEIPNPNTDDVCHWLQELWNPPMGKKKPTPNGVRLQVISEVSPSTPGETELSIFVWSVQRTTYLKIFAWGNQPFPSQTKVCRHLEKEIRKAFPQQYPQLPELDTAAASIFDALEAYYPKTVHFFRKMPQGNTDLQRVYWWEKRWRESVKKSSTTQTSDFSTKSAFSVFSDDIRPNLCWRCFGGHSRCGNGTVRLSGTIDGTVGVWTDEP
ncbi:Lycopene cyclase, CruA type [Crocosphaera watsonii WH 0402]|uniref:Lycopene cyclase, CruA type n=2 Tax=Crocosphaera watsonii TaxID=263511 RepID=T2JLZ2_CROWT|nr:Lycopene cyclase, CruA type [Crocosphaera watsonii WH 0005]CCQ66848.1 Lycopene cyclase, CruA type [Crocosphaera watsonii WH 0402]